MSVEIYPSRATDWVPAKILASQQSTRYDRRLSDSESDMFVCHCAQAEGSQTLNPLHPDENLRHDRSCMSCFPCKGQLHVTVNSSHLHIV